MLIRFFSWIVVFFIVGALAACGRDEESPASERNSNPAPSNSAPATQTSAEGSGSAPTTAAGGGVVQDACTLLTRAEVEAALSVPVGEVLSSLPGTQFPACEFSAPGSRAELLVQVIVNPFFNNNAARGAFDALKPSNAVNVSGVGDGAYWIADRGRLALLKGKHVVSVDVRQTTDKDRQTVARDLASKAVTRLP